MSEFVPGATTDDSTMPFTKFVMEAEAKWAKEHPEDKNTPLSQTEIGKVIFEQEAKVASDHAAGLVSDDEYASFRALSESRIESIKAHVQEVGDAMTSWKVDAVENFKDFKAEHPEIMADMNNPNPSIGTIATGFDVMVETIDPMIDPMVDMVGGMVDVVTTDLGDTAQDFIDARADMENANSDDIEASRVKVEAVRETLDADVAKAHDALDAFADGVHDALPAASDALHSYADSHPDSHVNDVSPAAISDPQLIEEMQQETGITEA
jgi:ElaB/YqjD/DUF883 family membrane-anchored ribosome-binding protein